MTAAVSKKNPQTKTKKIPRQKHSFPLELQSRAGGLGRCRGVARQRHTELIPNETAGVCQSARGRPAISPLFARVYGDFGPPCPSRKRWVVLPRCEVGVVGFSYGDSTMAKNAPKSLVMNPSIKQSQVDCIDTAMNGNGNAVVITIKMLAGKPEEKSAKIKEDGKEKNVTWKVMGSIDLDGTFEVDGVECRLVAVKKYGRLSSLEVRPVGGSSSATQEEAFVGF